MRSGLNGSIIPSLSRYLLNEDPAKTVSPSVLMSDHLTQSMGSVECSDTEDLDPDSNIGAHESRPSSENPELMDLSGRNDDSSSKTADPRLSKMNAVLDVAEPVSAPRSPPCLDPPPEFHPSFVGNREVCYPQFGEGTPRTELVNVGGRQLIEHVLQACTPHPWNPVSSETHVVQCPDSDLESHRIKKVKSKSRSRKPLDIHGGHFDCNWRLDGGHRGRPRTVKRLGSDTSLDLRAAKHVKHESPLKASVPYLDSP
ncbi:hypothetical protein M422DRAFT_49023 [Sphaerobolus stellatus SS14]|uniref:Uncharacterized protein n=1 Tax=Sphaerobolus stellatus (strain SS14) TaxID=990650 RepID=A0A0C9VR91_SPHS4|nr:hypothetical protein M422DRAFT_49023 [Sphaerobolus stellatus SS14]